MKITIEMPQIIAVSDYHELGDACHLLRELMGNRSVKVRELGCCYNYYGILYAGKLPSVKEIAQMLSDTVNGGWALEDCVYFVKHGGFPE